MHLDELQTLVMSPLWRYLGGGSYHQVYCSMNPLTIDGVSRFWVLKIPQAISEDIDTINRISRVKMKLNLLNPEYSAFHLDGYRLEITKNIVPSDDLIRKDNILIYSSSNTLSAAFMRESGSIARVNLNDHLSLETITRIMNDITQSKKISFEDENLIFQALECTRECMIFPYLGETIAIPHDIALELINIYKKHRIIVVDAEVPGNFLTYNECTVCVDVDHAYRCDSPISQKNLPEWIDINSFYDGEPTRVVEALLYLEEHLEPSDIDDKFLFLELIQKLYDFLEEGIPITKTTLNLLFQTIEFSRGHLIDEEDITPDLIVRLEENDKMGMTIDINIVSQVIGELLASNDDEVETRSDISSRQRFYQPEKEGKKRTGEEIKDERTFKK